MPQWVGCDLQQLLMDGVVYHWGMPPAMCPTQQEMATCTDMVCVVKTAQKDRGIPPSHTLRVPQQGEESRGLSYT